MTVLDMLNASPGVTNNIQLQKEVRRLAKYEIRHSCIESCNETWAVKMKQNIQVLHASGFTRFCRVGFLGCTTSDRTDGSWDCHIEIEPSFLELSEFEKCVWGVLPKYIFKLTLLGRLAMFILPVIWQARQPMFNAWLWSTRGKSR